jgi:hypothetical protein
MLKIIEDGRGNLKMVPVPGDAIEEQRAMMEIMRIMQTIDPDELTKAFRLDLSELRIPAGDTVKAGR